MAKSKPEQPQGLSVVEKTSLKKELEEYINLQLAKRLTSLDVLAEKISKIEDLLSNGLQKTTNFKLKENNAESSEPEEELSYFDRIVSFNDDEGKISLDEIGNLTDDDAEDENFESLDIRRPEFAKPKVIQEPKDSFDISVDEEKEEDITPVPKTDSVIDKEQEENHYLSSMLISNNSLEESNNQDEVSEEKEPEEKPQANHYLSSLLKSSNNSFEETNTQDEILEEKEPEEKLQVNHSLSAMLISNDSFENSDSQDNISEEKSLSDMISNSSETDVNLKEEPDKDTEEDIAPVVSKPLSELLVTDSSDIEEKQPETQIEEQQLQKPSLSLEDKYGDILGEVHSEEQPAKKSFDLANFVNTESENDDELEDEIKPTQPPAPPAKKKFFGLFGKKS